MGYLLNMVLQIAVPQDRKYFNPSSPTGHVGPEGSRRVKAPSFRDNGTVRVVGCQPYTPAAFTPRSIPDDRKHIWYSFLLEAESTPRAIVRPTGLCRGEKS